MRHASQVGNPDLPADVFAQRERNASPRPIDHASFQHIAEVHDRYGDVRHFDANDSPAGNRSLHADRAGAEPERQIVQSCRDPADRHADGGLQSVLRHRRPLVGLHHSHLDAEARQRLLDNACLFFELADRRLSARLPLKKCERRSLPCSVGALGCIGLDSGWRLVERSRRDRLPRRSERPWQTLATIDLQPRSVDLRTQASKAVHAR